MSMNIPGDESNSANGDNGSSNGNSDPIPVEVLDPRYPPFANLPPIRQRRQPLWPALLLFLLTLASTLAVGSEFALSYAHNRAPFSGDANPFAMMLIPFQHPRLLALGIPFSFTLLAILLAHELGHFFACKFYGIDASYPYFIPAPTLFGTFGAFIRIRSPITTRRALFDVGLSGPVAGFVIALPALAIAVATSKIDPGAQDNAVLYFGNLPALRLLVALFHPHVNPAWVLLSPVGGAAWVGLFVTGLNLLPVWQLDGGHIVFSVASSLHQRISLAVALALFALGIYCWRGWLLWGAVTIILSLRFRHPPIMDRWRPLDPARRAWAVAALVIFLLCFTPWPAANP
jgi:membrane-associated protease RseP (regulator of RpoE activity)